jgi:hypothetical protein
VLPENECFVESARFLRAPVRKSPHASLWPLQRPRWQGARWRRSAAPWL